MMTSLGNYGQRVGDRIAKFSAYFGLEMLKGYVDDSRLPSLNLVNELSQAWSDVPFMLSWVANPATWNISELLETEIKGGETITKLRKPKLEIISKITQAGNLSVRWFVVNEDFLVRRFPEETSGRPKNELLFVRGFQRALNLNRAPILSSEQKMLTTEALKLCLDAVDEIVRMAQVSCDVDFSRRVLLRFDDDGKTAFSFEQVSTEELDQRARLPFLEELRQLESEINMPMERLLALTAAYMRNGFGLPKIRRILEDHYGLEIADGRSFPILVNRCRNLNFWLGNRIEIAELTSEQLALAPLKKVKSAAEMRAALFDRIATETRPEKTVAAATIPVYPNRTYGAPVEELVRFGVQDVRSLVEKFNMHQIEQGRPPLSQADYPTNKKAFEKLLQRAEAVGLSDQSEHGKDFKL